MSVPGSVASNPLIILRTIASEAKSASDTLFTLLTKQSSAVALSNRTAESISLPMSSSRGAKRFGLPKKLGTERASNAIKKLEKTGSRSESIGKIEINILVFSAAASTAGASAGTWLTHEVPVVKVDGDGTLTILFRISSNNDGASGSVQVPLAAAPTGGASEAWFTYMVPDVMMEDDGVLTILPRLFPVRIVLPVCS